MLFNVCFAEVRAGGTRLLGRRVVTNPKNSELDRQVKPGRLKEDLTAKTLANLIGTNVITTNWRPVQIREVAVKWMSG
jgi:hypothetical protein